MIVILLLLILGFNPFAAAAAPLAQSCSGGYTATSTYQANFDLLSIALPKNASTARTQFSNCSVGAAPDAAYGLALCRRGDDANATACADCVAAAFQDAQRMCGFTGGSSILYEACIVHLSHRVFVYGPDDIQRSLLIIGETIAAAWSPGDVDVLLNETAMYAAYNSTTARYATGRMDVNGTGFPPLYSLAQCTPDLPPTDCWDCLHNIISTAKNYFTARMGGRIATMWCNFRYSTYQFYKGQPMRRMGSSGAVVPTAPPPVPVVVPSQKHKRRMVKVLLIATIVPLLALFLCFIFFCFGLTRKHRKGKVSQQEDEAIIWGIGGSSEFTFFNFSQVSDATSNFSDENKLGQGGFGTVFKGQFPDGLEVAIKRLASHSGQGFIEFKNEVQLIAKLQHTNLVRLLGCCSQGEEKILIYEYLPNKSLDFFIFDERRRALLNWNKILAIIEGIAQGLLYLHKHSRLRVIHRDLKASNILLDNEMNPKISDFGLAKIFSSNDAEGTTQRIAGTYGYMAPEYASEGIFSIKSDVFSFGVLVLEIISGTRNSGFHQYGNFFNLLGYAWKSWKEERWLEIVDASLVSEINALEMMRCVNIALLCVQENAGDRPTMSDVVAMRSDSMTLPEPNHPAYFHVRVTKEGSTVVEPSSTADMTMSVLCGR